MGGGEGGEGQTSCIMGDVKKANVGFPAGS